MQHFLSNKYTIWYYSIIEKAKSQQRIKNKGVYFESHHIIPKCMGGDNFNGNLVLLTAREHYIAHLLLVKMTVGRNKSKMSWAFRLMAGGGGKTHDRYVSKSYELHRKSAAQSGSGEHHPMYGREHSEETKLKMSEAKSGENHPMYGKSPSEETKERLSEAKRGEKNHNYGKKFSKEVLMKQSLAKRGDKHPLYGTSRSKETRELLSKAIKGIPHKKATCPHCQKTGGVRSMKRWHFENCSALS